MYKKIRSLLSELLIFALLTVSVSFPVKAEEKSVPAVTEEVPGDIVPGELIVKFSESPETLQGAEGAWEGLSFSFLSEGGESSALQGADGSGGGIYLLSSSFEGEDLAELKRKLESSEGVEYAEYNHVYQTDSYDAAKDYTDLQWGYAANTGTYSGNVHMGADDPEGPGAVSNWNEYEADQVTPKKVLHPETAGVVVAVVDTGVDYMHEDLKDAMWEDGLSYPELTALGGGAYGYCAAPENSAGVPYDPADPMDDHKHGTHVAGIIAASWNGTGVSGAADGIQIMAVKAGTDAGKLNESTLIRSFRYIRKAMESGVNVAAVNCSWGGDYIGKAFSEMITAVGEQGAVTVKSAGNSGTDLDILATDTVQLSENPYVVTVASMDSDGSLSYFTDYGKKSVQVAAPGYYIYSTIPRAKGTTDVFSPVTTASDATGGKARDGFESSYEAGDGTVSGTFFEYSSGVPLRIRDISGERGNVLRLSMEDALLSDPGADSLFMTVKADLSGLTGGVPSRFAFGYRAASASDALKHYGECILYDEEGEVLSSESFSLKTGWNTVWAKVPEDAEGELKISVTFRAEDTEGTEVADPAFAMEFDEMMFTDSMTPYGYSSGTSMAAPHVSGEAAVIVTQDYASSYASLSAEEKEWRAREVAARIRGSVEPLAEESEREKLASGGYARIDYALRHRTMPVLNKLELSARGDTVTAILSGFYLNGTVSTEGEGSATTDCSSVTALSVDGEDLTSALQAMDVNGTWLRFTLPEKYLSGEHTVCVTAGGRTGTKVFFTGAEEAYLERLPVTEEMEETTPVKLAAVDGTLYYLGEANAGSEKVEEGRYYLWKRSIRDSGAAWEQAASFEEETYLAAFDRKLVIVTGTAEDGFSVYTYTQEGLRKEQDLTDIPADAIDPCFGYARGRFLVFYLEPLSDTQCRGVFGSYDPVTFAFVERLTDEEGYSSMKSMLSDGEGGVYLFDQFDEAVFHASFDGGYSMQLTAYMPFEGLADSVPDSSYARVKEGYLAAGPVTGDGKGNIGSDLYLFDSSMANGKALGMRLDRRACSSLCTEAYRGKIYVAGCSTEGMFIAAGDMETAAPEADERILRETEEEEETEPSLPAYADASGKWEKETDAEGNVKYYFTKADGKRAKDEWVAVACSTWNRKDFRPYEFRWFSFDEKGVMRTGWFTDKDGKKYYLDPAPGTGCGSMVTGTKVIDGKTYVFRDYSGGPLGSLTEE